MNPLEAFYQRDIADLLAPDDRVRLSQLGRDEL